MKLSKSAVQKSTYQRQPQSTFDNDTLNIWYTTRTIAEGNKKYVKLHAEDRDYIFMVLERFLADFAQLQFIEPQMHRVFYAQCDWLPRVTREYAKRSGAKYNSINSYVAGLLSNRYRNPDVDFTKNQLSTLEKLFAEINNVYSQLTVHFRAGYDRAGNRNPIPVKIAFHEA